MKTLDSRSLVTPQQLITSACEKDLRKFGDTYLGADSGAKSQLQVDSRYRVMLDVVRGRGRSTVLDLGCGPAHMLDYIRRAGVGNVDYTGLDLSPLPLEIARAKHPDVTFLQMDVIEEEKRLPTFDYVILCGLLSYRGPMSRARMMAYWRRLISCAFRHARVGIAFNVMSKIVDWERDDLFHLPFDTMARFVSTNLSRRFAVRHDYGGFEYTTYVYRENVNSAGRDGTATAG